jgi:hypothetical protein
MGSKRPSLQTWQDRWPPAAHPDRVMDFRDADAS